MQRRDFLLTGAAAAVTMNSVKSLAAESCAMASCDCPQVGLILYTVRDHLKTAEEAVKTLKKISDIGYRNIEITPFEALTFTELAKVFKDNGLKAVSGHGDFKTMLSEPQKEIDRWAEVGCKHIVCSSMPGDFPRTEDGFKQFAEKCNIIGQNLAKAGVDFGYHNHNFEFHKYNGLTGQEILLRNTDPKTVKFEIDTYWVQAGGACPATWIRKVFGRIVVSHYKDMVMHDGKAIFAEIGEGNLDWQEIVKASRESGVKYLVVEQDACLRDSLESAEISFKNLKAMGLA